MDGWGPEKTATSQRRILVGYNLISGLKGSFSRRKSVIHAKHTEYMKSLSAAESLNSRHCAHQSCLHLRVCALVKVLCKCCASREYSVV